MERVCKNVIRIPVRSRGRLLTLQHLHNLSSLRNEMGKMTVEGVELARKVQLVPESQIHLCRAVPTGRNPIQGPIFSASPSFSFSFFFLFLVSFGDLCFRCIFGRFIKQDWRGQIQQVLLFWERSGFLETGRWQPSGVKSWPEGAGCRKRLGSRPRPSSLQYSNTLSLRLEARLELSLVPVIDLLIVSTVHLNIA